MANKKTRILMCDDEDCCRKIGKEILNILGRDCKAVSTPTELFQELRSARYDAVILDIQNLEQSGSLTQGIGEVSRRIRDLYPSITIFGVSGFEPEDYDNEIKEYFDDLMSRRGCFIPDPISEYKKEGFKKLEKLLKKHEL